MNGFEVSTTKEAVCIVLRFTAPDGRTEIIYVIMSPAGTVMLKDGLEKAVAEYTEKFGKIAMNSWKTENPNSTKNNSSTYLT